MIKIILMIIALGCAKNINELKNTNKGINEDNLIRYCREGKIEKALTLLNENPNVNVNFKDKNGNTALSYAFYNVNSYDRENLDDVKKILKLLIERGADVNLKNSEDDSPLFVAINVGASFYLYADIVKLCVDIIELLLEYGADVNLKNKDGYIPFRCVLNLDRNTKMAKALLKGYKLNFKDDQGFTLLMHSVFENNKKMMKILVERGENIDEKDSSGKTALMYAVDNENLDIATMLLNLGAQFEDEYKEKLNELVDKITDINFKDKKGNTNLILFSQKGEL